jgi:hypothetical protein
MIIKHTRKEVPRIVEQISSCRFMQSTRIEFSIKKSFAPQDGSLRYSLSSSSPDWLFINEITGMITGKTPPVNRSAEYNVAVTASNSFGYVIARFKLLVTATEMEKRLSGHYRNFLWENDKGLAVDAESLPKSIEQADYIEALFELFTQDEKQGRVDLRKLLQKAAQEYGIELSSKISLNDFEQVLKSLNPEVCKTLDQLFGRLSDTEFRNMLRQGSQPLGVHPIALWNYLAAPKQHVFNMNIESVLQSAVADVIHLREEIKTNHGINAK